MSVPVIQVDNVGTVFVFTVRDQDGALVNLATATTLEARFRPGPDGATFTRTGVLTTDGTDGKYEYASIAGDLPTPHDCWQRQGRVVIPGVGEFYTNVIEFSVKPNI